MTLHKIDREKLAEAMKGPKDGLNLKHIVQAAENWLAITDPGFEVSDEMLSDGVAMLPIEWKEDAEHTWEKHKSTSGLVRNIFAVKDAFKAMIAKAG